MDHFVRRSKEVKDPNGVWTGFEYDQWGQQKQYTEGRFQSTVAASYTPVVKTAFHIGNSGRVISARNPNARVGDVIMNASSSPTSSTCRMAAGAGSGSQTQSLPPGFPDLPCAGVNLPPMSATFEGATYSPQDQLTNMQLLVEADRQTKSRAVNFTWDAMGRVETSSTQTTESGSSITRAWNFDYFPNQGQYKRFGPDAATETFVQLDANNRVEFVRRGPVATPLMTATYTYHTTNLLNTISYGNGASSVHTWDNRNRIQRIQHNDGAGIVALQLDYTYTPHDLPMTITESGTSWSAVTTFTYDRRKRLTAEVRTGSNPYNLAYTYDKGGNRLTKTDALNNRRTVYHYDKENPSGYQSDNNRLVYYEVFDTLPDPDVKLSTTWYEYHVDGELSEPSGNVGRIITKSEGSSQYNAVRFAYARNGQSVSYVLGEQWNWNGVAGNCPTNYTVLWAREFRYDSGRARYLNRPLDAAGLMQSPQQIIPLGDVWTDYDDDEPYRDYTASGSTVTNGVSYEPGAWDTVGGSARYLHSDHLGTIRLTTGSNGTAGTHRVFTQFGEIITGPSPPDRFGYRGDEEYQAHSEFPFLCVGTRYYDPESGRFLQRAANGVRGDLNVYVPVRSGGDDKARGDDPAYDLNQEQLEKEIADAKSRGDKKRVQQLTKIQKHKKWRNVAKRMGKRGAKRIPIIAVGCFAYDWYNDGFTKAANEALWPLSKLWE